MQEIEHQAFAIGVSAADLMDQAGAGIARAIQQFHPRPGTAILYLGKGNNAGDALVAARYLLAQGWRIWARLAFPLGSLLAQKIPTHDAAPLGAWLCGRAAENAALHQHPNATLPTSVATHLGHALRDLTELAF